MTVSDRYLVTGVEHHPTLQELPQVGRYGGVLVRGLDREEIRARLDAGELLFLRAAR